MCTVPAAITNPLSLTCLPAASACRGADAFSCEVALLKAIIALVTTRRLLRPGDIDGDGAAAVAPFSDCAVCPQQCRRHLLVFKCDECKVQWFRGSSSAATASAAWTSWQFY